MVILMARSNDLKIMFRLDKNMNTRLEKYANAIDITKSELIRDAIDSYLMDSLDQFVYFKKKLAYMNGKMSEAEYIEYFEEEPDEQTKANRKQHDEIMKKINRKARGRPIGDQNES